MLLWCITKTILKHFLNDQGELHQATGEADEAEEKLRLCNKTLDQLKDGVGGLFSKIGCNAAGVEELLGGQQGITNNNIMLHLGIIEQRANDLLRIQQYLQNKVPTWSTKGYSWVGNGKGPDWEGFIYFVLFLLSIH